MLDDDEYIIEISIAHEQVIYAVVFITNKNRSIIGGPQRQKEKDHTYIFKAP